MFSCHRCLLWLVEDLFLFNIDLHANFVSFCAETSSIGISKGFLKVDKFNCSVHTLDYSSICLNTNTCINMWSIQDFPFLNPASSCLVSLLRPCHLVWKALMSFLLMTACFLCRLLIGEVASISPRGPLHVLIFLSGCWPFFSLCDIASRKVFLFLKLFPLFNEVSCVCS